MTRYRPRPFGRGAKIPHCSGVSWPTALCYPLGPGPTPIQSTHGEVYMSLRRREFITVLGGAAAWPLAAKAQQRAPMRHIGILLSSMSDDPVFQTWVGAFHQGLAQSGWFIGRNVRIDTRWAGAK